MVWLYVGRCKSQATAEKVRSYLVKKSTGYDFEVTKLNKAASIQLKDILYEPSHWPNKVLVKAISVSEKHFETRQNFKSKDAQTGKQDLPKIRPLNVEFSSRQEALSILVKRPKMPLKEFPNVNFKNDYIQRFREEFTSMYKEIEQRRAQGENLRVKFVSGQPTIVSATPKRPRDEEESPDKNAAKINKGKANSSKNYY
ncbi:hypothetical protein JTB14_038108 [Gonioctena quinquepunctata]|nr:hypothetical protein JTB14_038108 [Gonioctena quinquepunctata]